MLQRNLVLYSEGANKGHKLYSRVLIPVREVTVSDPPVQERAFSTGRKRDREEVALPVISILDTIILVAKAKNMKVR